MLRRALILAVALVATAALARGPSHAAPWDELAAARALFEEAPWTADFVQTYVPAGFSSGERETGRVSVALPDSLRWDYEVPYPKVFLVRGGVGYSWNEGEAAGRRLVIAEQDRRHLELLQLDLDGLRAAFAAETQPAAGDGTVVVALTPLAEAEWIERATLRLDPATHRLVGLGWSDLEGNRTEFTLTGHRMVADRSLFEAPTDLDWLDE